MHQNMRPQARWGQGIQRGAGMLPPQFGMQQQQQRGGGRSQRNNYSGRQAMAQPQPRQAGGRGGPNQPGKQGRAYPPGARNNMPPQPMAQPAVDGAAVPEGKGPVVYDTTRLTNAAKPEQKQILGEWLFPKIQELEHQQAGKITGMLLEIENTEIMHLLEDQGALVAKVEEAVEVLKAHQQSSKDVPAEQ